MRPVIDFATFEYLRRFIEQHFVFEHNRSNRCPDIVSFGQSLEYRRQQVQLCVVHVVVPRRDRQCALWMHQVRSRTVVNNDCVFELSGKS